MEKNSASPDAGTNCSKNLEDETLQSLVAAHAQNSDVLEIASKKFEELCITLESEQTRLLDLEQRRRQLQEDMQKLRQEIEEEKKFYHTAIEETIAFGNENVPPAADGHDKDSNENWGVDTDEVKKFIERQNAELKKTCDEEIKVNMDNYLSMEVEKDNRQASLEEGECDSIADEADSSAASWIDDDGQDGDVNQPHEEIFFSDEE